MGGDEFAILIEPGPDAARAEQTAARVVEALAVPVGTSSPAAARISAPVQTDPTTGTVSAAWRR